MKIPLCKMQKDFEILETIKDIIETGWYVNGPHIKAFENAISEQWNVKHTIAVNSGTSAIYASLLALGIEPGDEIIVPSFTFFATISPILALKARPIFIDIEPKSYLLDISLIEKKITSKTKVIIPVHLYGRMVNMNEIREIAEKYSLYILEDACQAHGAQLNGNYAGSMGDIGCFSLYPSKNLTVSGQGGLVTTNDEEIYEKLIALRTYGQTSKYSHDYIGFNLAMSEITAAFGEKSLTELPEHNKTRIKNAEKYAELLDPLDKLNLPIIESDFRSVYHLFVINIPSNNWITRDLLQGELEKAEIQTGIHYPIPCHKQSGYLNSHSGEDLHLPNTERLSNEILSLPMSPFLNEKEIEHICKYIDKVIKR